MAKAIKCDVCGKLIELNTSTDVINCVLPIKCGNSTVACKIEFMAKECFETYYYAIDVCEECRNKILSAVYDKFIAKKAREYKGPQ